jgi:hypothetical protein
MGRCCVCGIIDLGNILDVLGEIMPSIIGTKELGTKIYRRLTIKAMNTDIVKLKPVHGIDDVVNVTSREVKKMLIEALVVNVTLLIDVTPKVDVVDELLEFVLGHGLDAIKHGHS